MQLGSKILVSALLLSSAPSAYSYLDPGTGSMIVQGAIAALAMISVTAKTYWFRIKEWFSTSSAGQGDVQEDE